MKNSLPDPETRVRLKRTGRHEGPAMKGAGGRMQASLPTGRRWLVTSDPGVRARAESRPLAGCSLGQCLTVKLPRCGGETTW